MKIRKDWVLIQYNDILNMITKFNNIMLRIIAILLLILAFFSPLLSALGVLIIVGLNKLWYININKKDLLMYVIMFIFISLLWIINTLYQEDTALYQENYLLKQQNKIIKNNYNELFKKYLNSVNIVPNE